MPSSRSTRAWCGSMWRKSRVSAWKATSAMRAGQLDAGGAAADDHEGEPRALRRRIALALGGLEGQRMRLRISSASSMVLRPGRERRPLVVAEVGVRGAGGDDEVVVVDGSPSSRMHAPSGRVDGGGLGEQHLGVVLLAHDAADRLGDVGRVERRGRHLVEQRLEEVVVAAVEQRDAHRRVGERARA